MIELTELQKMIAKELLSIASDETHFFTYLELGNKYSLHPRFQVPDEVGMISRKCHELGLPLLSVLVVNQKTREPGIGFNELCNELQVHPELMNDADAQSIACINDVRACSDWSALERYLAEIPDPVSEVVQTERIEGKLIQIHATAYERDPKNRAECLRIHGTKCAICGFDAAEVYGEEFRGHIHVHHIEPLGEVGAAHAIDPATDLIPVCPNCHMILHAKKGRVLKPEDVRAMYEAHKQ